MLSSSELDFIIIRECLGLHYERYARDTRGCFVRLNETEDMVLFRPSQNIKDAWIALDKFKGDFVSLYQRGPHSFTCTLVYNTRLTTGSASTPSLAICDAMVKAVAKSKEVN